MFGSTAPFANGNCSLPRCAPLAWTQADSRSSISLMTNRCPSACSTGCVTTFTSGAFRRWTFRAGSKAPECAGRIHSDIQRGFIRAEVIGCEELLSLGSWAKAKELGKLRVEGKEYEFSDGDVTEFRFNV